MAGRGITIEIKGDGESARKALEMVQQQLHETAEAAKHESSEMAEAMERVKIALEYAGIYMGLEEVREALHEMVEGSIELGEEIGHLSQQTGISAQNLSTLKYVSDATGISFEALTKGMKRLSVEMLGAEEGKKESIATFRRLGIAQEEVVAHSHDMYGMLELIADKFAKMPEGPNKAAEAQALFGKAGMQLIPILNQGSAGIEELKGKAETLGLVLSENTVERMEELHRSMVETKGAAEGLGLALTEAIGPALRDLSSGAAGTIKMLREMINLKEEATGVTDSDSESFKKINPKYLAMSDVELEKHISDAGRRARAGDEELDQLKGRLQRKEITEKQFAARSLKLQKEADDARLEQAQAAVVRLEEVKEATTRALHVTEEHGFEQYDERGFDRTMGPKGADARAGIALAEAYKTLKEARSKHEQSGTDDLELQPPPPAKPLKSDNAIPEAAARLADEQAKAAAGVRKIADQIQLAELEAQHKMLLISDQEFYAERLRLQTDAVKAEQEELESKTRTLEALRARQMKDPTLKKDARGNKAEVLRTERELVEVGEQLNALQARRAQITSASNAETSAGNQAAALAGLKAAAEYEKQRGDSILAQIALIRQEHELEAQKITHEGGTEADAASVRAAGDLLVKKLQIEDVSKRIAESEADNRRAVEQLNDAVTKDPRLKRGAEKQINELNRQEAESLRGLVAEYDALAAAIGNPETLQRAKDLHAELAKLNTPDQRQEANFAKKLGDSVAQMAGNIAEKAAEGRESFHSMVTDIEHDIERLAIKFAEEKWLMPALEGAFGGLGGARPGAQPAAAQGPMGMGGMPTLSGLAAAMDWHPTLPAASSGGGGFLSGLLGKITGGTGKSAPNVKVEIVNQSSQAVSATSSSANWDEQARSFVIHTVLENASSGGELSTMFRAFTG